MRTTVTAHLTHLCPHAEERDYGTVTLAWDGEAPELHGLRKFLDSWARLKVTHEQLTQTIADEFPTATVTTEFVTAGIVCVCEVGPA